ncbi:MAG: curli production assembly protein CsgG [Ignavibacteria bacterium]|nr:curli production assembly protein CsgG [Ignavibacteria bacterium]
MKLSKLLLLPLIAFILLSCSSVKPPITSTLTENEPQISKTNDSKFEKRLKRKVAIARFTNETKYGQGFFYDKNEDRLGKQAMDIFSTRLASTEKFIMLERADLEYLNREKQIGNLGTLDISADYLILGSVTEFGRKATSDVGIFSRTKKQTAYAKVSVRLIEVNTGQIIYSEEGEGEAISESETVLGMGTTAAYDATLNDKVISAAISKLVSNISERLLDKSWRSYLLTYENDTYLIAGGTLQGIKEGDIFTVFKRGKKIINPQTNFEIELPGTSVGQLKVISLIPGDVNSEFSICVKVSGELPLTDFNDFYIQEN